MSTIEERVKKIIGEQLGVKQEEVTNNASFVEDLGADSLDTVELVMALEEEFDTEIPAPNAVKIRLSPFLNLFSKSQRQSGSVPALVLPYRSMFTMTFSGGIPNRCVTAAIMR